MLNLLEKLFILIQKQVKIKKPFSLVSQLNWSNNIPYIIEAKIQHKNCVNFLLSIRSHGNYENKLEENATIKDTKRFSYVRSYKRKVELFTIL